jgi:hypothetical protein
VQTSVSPYVVTVDAQINAEGAGGREAGTAVGTDEWWYVWVIHTAAGSTEAFLSPVTGNANGLQSGVAAWPTDYDWRALVGRAYLDSDGDFSDVRPMAGGSFLYDYQPIFGQIARGSYEGLGTGQSISGLGFKPDVVHVQRLTTAFIMCVGTVDYGGNSFVGTASIANGITSMDADGFTVGDHANVDAAGVIHAWVAWKASAGVA